MAATEMIRLDGISKRFDLGETSVMALRDVSLQIAAGEFVAIIGASGSGKSTLMNILGCLDQPSSGNYFLEGVQINRLDKRQLADIRNRRIGFVFQGFNLLARTSALENVELPLLYDRSGRQRSAKVYAEAALRRVGLGERMEHQPTQLSGGQQQRVAIARALVNEPAMLLADEPTGALDSRTSLEVLAIFQELNDQGITVIVVTHEADIAAHAKRLIEVRDGRIVRDQAVTRRLLAAETLSRLGGADEVE